MVVYRDFWAIVPRLGSFFVGNTDYKKLAKYLNICGIHLSNF